MNKNILKKLFVIANRVKQSRNTSIVIADLIRNPLPTTHLTKGLRVKPAMTDSRNTACRILTIAAIVCLFFCSCNPQMEVPSYIWVDSVDFQVLNSGAQGTASYKITDVKVTANGQSLGFYQLPARIPILESGLTKLNLSAGIMLGGVPQQRREYPFYTPYVVTVDLKKGKIDTLHPYYTYTDNAKFYQIEDFERAGMFYIAYEQSAPLKKTSEESLIFHQPKEINNYSGLVELPYYNDSLKENVYFFEIRTANPIELTASTITYCLMEINFRITHHVEIGIITHSSSIVDRQIALANLTGYDTINNTNNVWKKVYVNFTDEIGKALQLKNFDVYIRATIKENENARFLFDNIKIIYN